MKYYDMWILKKPVVIFILVICLVLPVACSSGTYKNNVYEDKHNVYQVMSPGKGWKRIATKDADLAFWNSKIAAFIMVNSTCDGYKDAPLESLSNHLFFGIEKKEFIQQKRVMLDGRQAVYSEVTGLLDGARVRVSAYTMVKNYCTYDISYSAPTKIYGKGLKAFEKVMERFRVIKRKRK